MADTVTVFNGNAGGTNYTVATDEVDVGPGIGTAQVQYVKLVDGSLNGDAPIVANAFGSLAVVPRQDVEQIQMTVPLTSATTYASGDQTGGICALTSAARSGGPQTGTIIGVAINDDSDAIGAMDVVFFTDTVTLAANGNPFTLATAGDRLKVIDVVSLNYAVDLGGNRFARLMGLAIPYKLAGTILYAAVISRSGWTTASASPLTITVYVARD
jgi:hypothetical protein